MSNNIKLDVKFSALNKKQKIVYGIVYSPNRLDGKGYFSTEEEVEALAHRFMDLNLKKAIDYEHNNKPTGSVVVESFISRGNSDFPKGSWVLGVKVTDNVYWDKILKGEINGYSMEIVCEAVPTDIEVEVPKVVVGTTSYSEDGHSHIYFVELNEAGRVIKGYTSEANGHTHKIDVNSYTDTVNNHNHKLDMV